MGNYVGADVHFGIDLTSFVEKGKIFSIEQIKNDEYGWCESCGDEIGVKRLEARPTATHCIDCKTLDEIKEKQLSG